MTKGTRELFYIGTASEEKVHALYSQNPFASGFVKDEEWAVLVDRTAVNCYDGMVLPEKMKKFDSYLKSELEANMKDPAYKKKAQSSRDPATFFSSLFKEAPRIKNSEITIDEDELRRRIIHETNDDLLHELCLHLFGCLAHDPYIRSIKFTGGSLDVQEMIGLLRKYNLKIENYHITDEKTRRVTGIDFTNIEAQSERIKKLYEELKGKRLGVQAWVNKKQYPVEFELDDIRIREKTSAT